MPICSFVQSAHNGNSTSQDKKKKKKRQQAVLNNLKKKKRKRGTNAMNFMVTERRHL